MNAAPIEAEVIPKETQALAIRPPQPATLFHTDEPREIVERASVVASSLKAVIQKQGLISRISGKEYPRCEAWTLLGTMLGVFPVCVWTREVAGGWEARVEARTRDGAVVGAAEAQCLHSERNWKDRDAFALRSMAQTRATAKCLRMPLGFVMTLAGYEATPAEEMVSDHPQKPAAAAAGRPATSPPSSTPDPAAKTPPAGSAGPSPAQKPATQTKIPFPTDESRSKMIAALKAGPGDPNREIVTEYFRKLDNPNQLMPNEELEDLPLRFVPATMTQMTALSEMLTRFGNGDRAQAAFPAHQEPEPPKSSGTPTTPTAPRTKNGSGASATTKPKDDEWWRDVIVPIPHKGQKRDDYLKHPETIGQLYDLRHGQDEESQAARQRLWGFINHYEAKPWTKRDGTQMPPSATDLKFREALDALADWHERNHPDEKL